MKIESSPLDVYRQAADRVGGPASGAGQASGQPAAAASGGDSVALSGDAQALQQAVRSAQDAPDIRQDLVERLRADLKDGKVGQDAGKLADAIIDSWIQGS